MMLAMQEWQGENNDMHFDAGVRILISGVRAELASAAQGGHQ